MNRRDHDPGQTAGRGPGCGSGAGGPPTGLRHVQAAALACLGTAAAEQKTACTQRLVGDWSARRLGHEGCTVPVRTLVPGRPAKPPLVPPRQLRRRRLSSPEGRAALLHAIAHIEFNAIDLALDAVYRFRGMPRDFYGDWVRIAGEEALHFSLVRQHLQSLGYDYGDFPAHNGLWEMAADTAYDSLARMALVPRVFEARGLDVNPPMRKRLWEAGDRRGAEILDVILHDEIGHVAAGNRWFHYLCRKRNLDPHATFEGMVRKHLKSGLRGPFDRDLRLRAGFTEADLALLDDLAG